MRENILFMMLIGILLLGFLSSSLTGYAPRGVVLDKASKTVGAGYDTVGNREYSITRGVRTDTLGGPTRAGYSVVFGNFPFEGKGDLDRDGEITENDFRILQTLWQRGRALGAPLQRTRSRWEYSDTKIVNSAREYGTYDIQGDIDDDGQITYNDVKVLYYAVNPYLGTRTSLTGDYKEMVDCSVKSLGSQTCAVDKRGQIGTCERFPLGARYTWADCPMGFSCMVRGHGMAQCVRDISRQMDSKHA